MYTEVVFLRFPRIIDGKLVFWKNVKKRTYQSADWLTEKTVVEYSLID